MLSLFAKKLLKNSTQKPFFKAITSRLVFGVLPPFEAAPEPVSAKALGPETKIEKKENQSKNLPEKQVTADMEKRNMTRALAKKVKQQLEEQLKTAKDKAAIQEQIKKIDQAYHQSVKSELTKLQSHGTEATNQLSNLLASAIATYKVNPELGQWYEKTGLKEKVEEAKKPKKAQTQTKPDIITSANNPEKTSPKTSPVPPAKKEALALVPAPKAEAPAPKLTPQEEKANKEYAERVNKAKTENKHEYELYSKSLAELAPQQRILKDKQIDYFEKAIPPLQIAMDKYNVAVKNYKKNSAALKEIEDKKQQITFQNSVADASTVEINNAVLQDLNDKIEELKPSMQASTEALKQAETNFVTTLKNADNTLQYLNNAEQSLKKLEIRLYDAESRMNILKPNTNRPVETEEPATKKVAVHQQASQLKPYFIPIS